MNLTSRHFKKWILVQVRGGAKSKTAGILKYFEDFRRGTNPAKVGKPKDFFEIASKQVLLYMQECHHDGSHDVASPG